MSSTIRKITIILLVISLASAIAAVLFYLQTPPLSSILKVTTGSMCVTYNSACPGRLSPDEPTLHVGDFIVFEAVDHRDLSVDYPNSDIIVFHEPSDPDDLIVHRIVAVNEVGGYLYFRTKGDGNSHIKWPDIPSPSEYDPWTTEGVDGVREDLIVGKVVNYNLPLELLITSFWTLLGLSIATGIAAIIVFVSSSMSGKRNNRIEELEDRIRRLEAEKEDKAVSG